MSFPVGSPTSCCDCLGPQLDFLTGSEFFSVVSPKPSFFACSSGSTAIPFSTSLPCSVPPSVIPHLYFYRLSFFVGVRGGVGLCGVSAGLAWGEGGGCCFGFLHFFVSFK